MKALQRGEGGWHADLVVPNRDVASALFQLVHEWVERAQPDESAVRRLLTAMLAGHTEVFGRELGALVLRAMSFHDVIDPDPERVFHAFVLGLLVLLEPTHQVISNSESGEGHADAVIAEAVDFGGAEGLLAWDVEAIGGGFNLDAHAAEIFGDGLFGDGFSEKHPRFIGCLGRHANLRKFPFRILGPVTAAKAEILPHDGCSHFITRLRHCALNEMLKNRMASYTNMCARHECGQ